MESKPRLIFGGRLFNVFSFVTPSKVQRVSYKNCKRQLTIALQRNASFEDGMLLDTMEKGVSYPIIHFASLAPHAAISNNSLVDCNSLGRDYVLQQGVYQEIRSITPALEEALNPPLRSPLKARVDSPVDDAQPAFIFIGFNGLSWGLQDVLEDTWKEWTGARYLYLHLPEKFGLSRITLYRRIVPSDITLFAYILLVECSNITADNQVYLLDFVQRFRAQRGQGFLSVYREAGLGSTSSADSALDCSSVASGSDVGSDDYAVRNQT